ncbi:MAG: AmmeMemoRadiSam system protein A [Planctomycetota bacterium]
MTDPGLEALPGVARAAIRAFLEGREPQAPVEPNGDLARAAPVFVTLRIAGALRGCMGDLVPRCANLVEETMERAVTAAIHDPRFPPLTLDELDATTIDVTILGSRTPVASPDELDPAVYGVDVSDKAGRRAVLLPDVEGVDSVAKQLSVVRRKAGIPDDAADVTIRRFRVLKVTETS